MDLSSFVDTTALTPGDARMRTLKSLEQDSHVRCATFVPNSEVQAWIQHAIDAGYLPWGRYRQSTPIGVQHFLVATRPRTRTRTSCELELDRARERNFGFGRTKRIRLCKSS